MSLYLALFQRFHEALEQRMTSVDSNHKAMGQQFRSVDFLACLKQISYSLILITIIKIEIIMFDASRIYHLNLYTNHLRRYSLTVIIFLSVFILLGFFQAVR